MRRQHTEFLNLGSASPYYLHAITLRCVNAHGCRPCKMITNTHDKTKINETAHKNLMLFTRYPDLPQFVFRSHI